MRGTHTDGLAWIHSRRWRYHGDHGAELVLLSSPSFAVCLSHCSSPLTRQNTDFSDGQTGEHAHMRRLIPITTNRTATVAVGTLDSSGNQARKKHFFHGPCMARSENFTLSVNTPISSSSHWFALWGDHFLVWLDVGCFRESRACECDRNGTQTHPHTHEVQNAQC